MLASFLVSDQRARRAGHRTPRKKTERVPCHATREMTSAGPYGKSWMSRVGKSSTRGQICGARSAGRVSGWLTGGPRTPLCGWSSHGPCHSPLSSHGSQSGPARGGGAPTSHSASRPPQSVTRGVLGRRPGSHAAVPHAVHAQPRLPPGPEEGCRGCSRWLSPRRNCQRHAA